MLNTGNDYCMASGNKIGWRWKPGGIFKWWKEYDKCNGNEYIAGNTYKANSSGTTSLPGANRAKMVLNPYGYFILYDGVANPSYTAQYLSQANTFDTLRNKGKAYYLSP